MPSPTFSSTSRPWVAHLPFHYGWVILAVASIVTFMSGPGQTYGVSVFVNPMIEDLGWSRTMISGLYTAGSLTAATTMILVGRLLDRYGARVMLIVVATLFGFAAIWMSNVSHPFHLYAGFAAIRILGQGSLTLIPTTLVALWFVRLRGRAMSLHLLGSAASLAFFPPFIHALVSSQDWRAAWTVLAFLIWGILLPLAVLLVRRTPESVGLLPDGISPQVLGSGEQATLPTSNEVNWAASEAVRTRSFWLLMFAGSSQSLIGTALVFHHVSLLASHGLEAGVAASVLSVLAPASLVGTFIGGFLSDRIPNRYIMAGGQATLALAMLLILVISQPWHAYVYGGLLGLTSGVLIAANAVIWPNYYGRAQLGTIRGAVTTSMVAFAALGPLPFGYLFDLTKSYTSAVSVFLALPVACAVAALLALPPRKYQS
jgi:MFS family permease